MEYRASHEQLAPHRARSQPRAYPTLDLTVGLVSRAGARHVQGACAWLVYELRPDDEANPRLVFECPELIRVVRTYPAHWRDLSDAELLALSDRV